MLIFPFFFSNQDDSSSSFVLYCCFISLNSEVPSVNFLSLFHLTFSASDSVCIYVY